MLMRSHITASQAHRTSSVVCLIVSLSPPVPRAAAVCQLAWQRRSVSAGGWLRCVIDRGAYVRKKDCLEREVARPTITRPTHPWLKAPSDPHSESVPHPESDPTSRSVPSVESAPEIRSVLLEASDPASASVPSDRSAPAFGSVPTLISDPFNRSVPIVGSAPNIDSVPYPRSAPVAASVPCEASDPRLDSAPILVSAPNGVSGVA